MRADASLLLSRLFLQCRPSLNRYFLRRRAPAWDAEDLVQEVYLRLQRSQVHAGEIANPEAYLFTIAANLLKEQGMRQQRQGQGTTALDHCVDEALSVPFQADSELHAEQRRERLALLMQQLPPRCRAAMVLRYREGLDHRQIATRLQISVPMVKKHIARGVALCRVGMDGYG
ncbi:RNA polymerase sigma factor [Xanthomonas maliensis]|uniref:RNA polymerase sigma factor n=1 Tax=Xanthomonas maliensis TaxID=1321368 RepID=UPI0004CE4589|nr:sigma-70 family RNA polymerase sigma factor [Xanthomonas maliensis]KAB7762240.1 sigma-70 family RNA polymerase sigma factor [Xanthomonas maliensis]